MSQFLNSGEIVKATVTSIETYGFWVEIDGSKGLVKIVDITWEPGKVEVEEHVSVGDVVRIKVLNSLDDTFHASLRDVHPEDNPWLSVPAKGSVINATVYFVADYGYLLKTSNNLVGLLKVDNSTKKYLTGEQIEVEVLSVNVERQRVEFVEA